MGSHPVLVSPALVWIWKASRGKFIWIFRNPPPSNEWFTSDIQGIASIFLQWRVDEGCITLGLSCYSQRVSQSRQVWWDFIGLCLRLIGSLTPFSLRTELRLSEEYRSVIFGFPISSLWWKIIRIDAAKKEAPQPGTSLSIHQREVQFKSNPGLPSNERKGLQLRIFLGFFRSVAFR